MNADFQSFQTLEIGLHNQYSIFLKKDYTIRQEIIREVKRYMITLMNVKYFECCSQNCVCKLNWSSFTVLALTRIPRILPLKKKKILGKKKLKLFVTFVTFCDTCDSYNFIFCMSHCHTSTFFFFFCDRCDSYNVTLNLT